MTADQIVQFIGAVRAGRLRTISHGDTAYQLRPEPDGSVTILDGARVAGSVFLGGVVGDPPVVIAVRDALPPAAIVAPKAEEPVVPRRRRTRTGKAAA